MAEPETYNLGVYYEVSFQVLVGSLMLGFVAMMSMPFKMGVKAARAMCALIDRVPPIDSAQCIGPSQHPPPLFPYPHLSGSSGAGTHRTLHRLTCLAD